MDRRSLIKACLTVSAGAFLFPSCVSDGGKASVLLQNFQVDGNEEAMLAELCETIIPKTDTPGAKDLGAHLFALMMVDDCVAKEGQQRFVAGMKAFKGFSENKLGGSFIKAGQGQREKLLLEIEGGNDIPEDIAFFYKTTKRYTVQAFQKSKFYLTQIEVYKLVPGPYKGCVPTT